MWSKTKTKFVTRTMKTEVSVRGSNGEKRNVYICKSTSSASRQIREMWKRVFSYLEECYESPNSLLLIFWMCTLRPDVMSFMRALGICASRYSPPSVCVCVSHTGWSRTVKSTSAQRTRTHTSIRIQHTNHSRVSFNLTVIWKHLHALWLFGLPYLMQKLCNLN